MANVTQNQSFDLTSFNGADLRVYAQFARGDDEKGGTITVELGTLSAISGVIKTQVKPKIVIGESEPIGISTGMRMISGNLRFEVLNESFVNSMKSVSVNPDIFGKKSVEEIKKVFTYNGNELKYADQLPPMDIIVTAISESDSSKKAMRVIRGVILTSQGSAIGLDSLTVQESYEFVARKIEPLKPIETNSSINGGE